MEGISQCVLHPSVTWVLPPAVIITVVWFQVPLDLVATSTGAQQPLAPVHNSIPLLPQLRGDSGFLLLLMSRWHHCFLCDISGIPKLM